MIQHNYVMWISGIQNDLSRNDVKDYHEGRNNFWKNKNKKLFFSFFVLFQSEE